MNKKKLSALLVAGTLTMGIVGGTFAWFTSQDNVTNVFNIGSVTDKNDGLDAGINIGEEFEDAEKDTSTGNMVYTKPVKPNQTLKKQVWVENMANYDQIVRAKVVKEFIDPTTNQRVTHWAENANGQIVYGDSNLKDGEQLNLEYIELATDLNGEGAPTGWTIQKNPIQDTTKQSESNWYYYNKLVKPNTGDDSNTGYKTSDLLKSVTLSKKAGSEYMNLRFDVKVVGESVQAEYGAIKDTTSDTKIGWENVPESIINLDTTPTK